MNPSGYQPKLELADWHIVNREEYEHILSIISPQLHSFVEEHAALSKLMDQVREGYDEGIYQKALAEIETELDQHFMYEERFILSRLRKYFATENAGPIMKLSQEHRVIRNNYQDAADLFANRKADDASARTLVQKMNLLAYLLKKHIEKEDHYFFPMVSLILSQEEKEAIAQDVKAAYLQRK